MELSMPTLQNAQYEAFALARAKGARLDDAYEDAGFAPGNGHASRIALRAEVAERIAELRREQAEAEDASPQATIAALVRMAKANEALKSVEGTKEARLNLIEAHRLMADLASRRANERIDMRHLF
jgi:hypothetical protein